MLPIRMTSRQPTTQSVVAMNVIRMPPTSKRKLLPVANALRPVYPPSKPRTWESKKSRAMASIMADHNVEGHFEVLLRL